MSSDVIGIRRAERPDLDLLPKLLSREGAQGETSTLAFDVKGWASQLAGEGVFTYVAEREHVFGFVTAGPAWLDDPWVGEILGLYLEPQHRRQGLGRKLLVRGLSVLKLRDFEKGILFLNEDTRALVHLLDGLGFEQSQYYREIKVADATQAQVGYLIDLADYF